MGFRVFGVRVRVRAFGVQGFWDLGFLVFRVFGVRIRGCLVFRLFWVQWFGGLGSRVCAVQGLGCMIPSGPVVPFLSVVGLCVPCSTYSVETMWGFPKMGVPFLGGPFKGFLFY